MLKPEVLGSSSQVDLFFFVEGQGQRHKVILPRELLDDEVGDSSSVAERKKWIDSNIEKIMTAYTAKTESGVAISPFTRIVVEEA